MPKQTTMSQGIARQIEGDYMPIDSPANQKIKPVETNAMPKAGTGVKYFMNEKDGTLTKIQDDEQALLDWYAGKALEGVLTHWLDKTVAHRAWEIAEEMMEARKQRYGN